VSILTSRGTIVLVIFAIIVAAIIGLSQFVQSQPPVEITVAVNPMAEDWMRALVADFNESEAVINGTTRITVNMTTTKDIAVWDDNKWSVDNHPDAWLPASSASVSYLNSNIPFQTIANSTAQTPLVWGGFQSRVDILTTGGILDWGIVAGAAQTDEGNWASLGGESGWGFLKFAYARPSNDIAGLAVLFSGASEFTESTTLDRSQLLDDEFNTWMEAIVASVPNFQTLGSNPAAAMASRGTSVAEIAFLPESLWLNSLNDLNGSDPITFNYPATQFVLDFPLTMWDDPDTSDETKLAVQAFTDYVTGTGQNTVTEFGLRPANGNVTNADSLFADGVSFGIVLEPDYGQIVIAPDKNTTETLLERFG
jgi:hypothetical protein